MFVRVFVPIAAATAVLLAGAHAADATTTPTVHGAVTSAVQGRTGVVTVTGWAYDSAAQASTAPACVWNATKCVVNVSANRTNAALDSSRRITGKHGFQIDVRASAFSGRVALKVKGVWFPSIAISTPGARVVAVARQYVGKARYVEDGASPKGFDCSGYTLYAYRVGNVATLPHNAEAQRHVAGMRRISAASARPGDLVFYMSGGAAYHVAIYAGGGKQYAAATPQDGIRYQAVWSSAVEYYTDWH